jgi:hypothetical protein
MDCIQIANSERARLSGRTVSFAFHLAVLERALEFISAHFDNPGPLPILVPLQELRAACEEALEAVAELRASQSRFP